MAYNTIAHIGDTVSCQVSWLGADKKPLETQNVTATLFHYVDNARVLLSGPNPMVATDQTHRFVYGFEIPSSVLGQTIYVSFESELVADQSQIFDEMSIYVSSKDTFIEVV
jgi:hypothetical protein